MIARGWPQAILLDALGTLVALDPPAQRLRAELAKRFGVWVPRAEAERAITAEISFYRANLELGKDADGLSLLRARCAEVLRAQLAGSSALARVSTDDMTDALLASIQFTVYPDVRPALRAARARGARLMVVSNWDTSLHEVLARLNLTPLLDGILTSAEAGARKPSPAIFAQALSVVQTAAERAIHVGDSAVEDVGGARAAGVEAVLLRRDSGPRPAGVRTITSLRELYS